MCVCVCIYIFYIIYIYTHADPVLYYGMVTEADGGMPEPGGARYDVYMYT